RRGEVPDVPVDLELNNGNHIYFYNTAQMEYVSPSYCQSFVMKVNSEGDILWVNHTRDYGVGSGTEFYSHLLDENSGNIYVSGLAVPVLPTGEYTILGENDTIVNTYNGEHAELKSFTEIVACYDTAGNYKWYYCPNALYCKIGSLATYNGKLYAALGWQYNLTCGDIVYSPYTQIQALGGYGIGEWDQQGNMTDVRQVYCKPDNTKPYDTRINLFGEIYTAGRFDNKMAFAEDTIIAQFETDMFLAKFGYSCPTYIYDTATYCYGDVVQGVTLTASGDYTFTYPEGGQEFDSIVLVHATVLPPLTIGLNDTTVCTAQQFYLDACGDFDSYQWSTGGTGCTEMLQFDNACTQSVSLTVTRGECSATRTISITAQVCDGITEPTATAMSLYPNPASDMVTIFGDGFVSATVIDLAGRTLLRTTAMQLDLSGLRPGEYVVKVERINGETEELKMVKE
ncbi:MAG: T9SS type A sorting domain-containing protein, partial [Bacteroidales bacterium]|nr:T9SS type A sorting domain-containing protein [Bacteroidales bacterium]